MVERPIESFADFVAAYFTISSSAAAWMFLPTATREIPSVFAILGTPWPCKRPVRTANPVAFPSPNRVADQVQRMVDQRPGLRLIGANAEQALQFFETDHGLPSLMKRRAIHANRLFGIHAGGELADADRRPDLGRMKLSHNADEVREQRASFPIDGLEFIHPA